MEENIAGKNVAEVAIFLIFFFSASKQKILRNKAMKIRKSKCDRNLKSQIAGREKKSV